MIIEEKDIQTVKKTHGLAKDLYLSLLHEGKFIYLDTYGMSMYPFIKNGDRIKIEPLKKEEIKIGNILALNVKDKNEAWFVVHRVVKIAGKDGNRIYFTKGDFNKKGQDNPVTIEFIAGRITEVQKKTITINFKRPLWKYFNNLIAKLSLNYPGTLHFLSGLLSLIIEKKLFLFKIKNRLKKGDPLLYNTEKLLLICVQKDLDEELKKKAQDLIKEGVDWEYFSKSAMRGGVTVLVYDALMTITSYVRVPQRVLDRLRSAYLFIISKVNSQYKEVTELLRLFGRNDIPALPLKGLLLSKRLYGDIAARGLSVDFDLLIKERDREKAQILLKELGYFFNPDDEIKEWQWQHNFFKVKATMVDLHWDVTMMGRSKERIERLWKGTRQVFADEDVGYYEFEEDKLLLYLSIHLVHSDSFMQLRYVCDINELLRKYKDTLDWSDIMENAKRWKVSNSLYAALQLSKSLFNSDIPLDVLQRLKPGFLKLILIKTIANKKVILRDCLRRRLMSNFLSYIFFELIEARSLSEYIAIIKRVGFPPKEVLLNAKNDDPKSLFIKYPIRLFKGVFKIIRITCFYR